MSSPRTTPVIDQQLTAAPLVPWQLVVWDDPVNLMSYVARIFRTYFGYPKEKAERLMLAVHNEGHAIVATGPRETMEMHAQAMHGFGLWATVRRADQ
jgi:ATP-dependent Clp protease adaptor protein ClpS